jgi:hypothetical protein
MESRMSVDTMVICCSDKNYFPLTKGLVLSILEGGQVSQAIGIGFIDIGCDATCLRWLRDRDIVVRKPDRALIGGLADESLGYQRAQVIRPFLPQLFPEARALIWADSDAWIQDVSILPFLRSAATREPDALFIAPECHYSYTKINNEPTRRRREIVSYCAPAFGDEIASELCERPMLNSGFFAMSSSNPIWRTWQSELRRLYLEDLVSSSPSVRHMAEQIALNVIAMRDGRVSLLDPIYNYLSLWTPPFRDDNGIVRVSFAPHAPVGVIHLAGGWKALGESYHRRGLLYRSGAYLEPADVAILFPQERIPGYR